MSSTRSATSPPSLALEQLFREHQARILRVAHKVTGNRSDAEDVLQTVFLRMWRRDIHLDPAQGVSSYLHRAAVNAAVDLLRARKRREIPTETEPDAVVDDRSPGSQVDRQRELREGLRNAIARLSDRAAQIFVLRYLEGYGNTEIAKMLDCSRTAVAVTLHRARGRLQKELQSYLGGAS